HARPPVAPDAEGDQPLLQIIIQGRGGQGAQTAGTLLAMAFFAEGRQVQSFASYGGARRGTPVSSFIRVDNRPSHFSMTVSPPLPQLLSFGEVAERLSVSTRTVRWIVDRSELPVARVAGSLWIP